MSALVSEEIACRVLVSQRRALRVIERELYECFCFVAKSSMSSVRDSGVLLFHKVRVHQHILTLCLPLSRALSLCLSHSQVHFFPAICNVEDLDNM